jgi:inner membrane transporter RhtA
LSAPLRPLLLAVLAAVFGMISVNAGAAVAKTLFASIGPEGMTVLRNGFGSMLLMLWWQPWRGGRLSPSQLGLLLAYGVNLGVMNLLYYWSLQRLPLGLLVSIEFIGPFAVALANSRRLADIFWVLLALLGLLLLLPWQDAAAPVDPIGVALALAAGATWAIYILLSQKCGESMPSGRVTAIGTGIAALVILPLAWGHTGAAAWQPTPLLLALAVALLSSAIPYTMDMIALKRLPTRTFGILMSFDPAAAALAGLVMLGERLTVPQTLAVACVMVASVGSTAAARRPLAAPPEL